MVSRTRPDVLGPRLVASLVVAACGLAGCARSAVPYRFQTRLVGVVGPDIRDEGDRPATSRPSRPSRPARVPPPSITPAAVALATAPPRSFRLAVPRPAPAASDDPGAWLRERVGERHTAAPVAFAIGLIQSRGGDDDRRTDVLAAGGDEEGRPAGDLEGADAAPRAPAHRGPGLRGVRDATELLEIARERGAELRDERPGTGDLLVFGPLDHASATIGVVVGRAPSGATEFVYLARDVVRRGYVSTGHPEETRDEEGRALNTFLRGSDGRDPRGTRYLASELLVMAIDAERLLGPQRRLVRVDARSPYVVHRRGGAVAER